MTTLAPVRPQALHPDRSPASYRPDIDGLRAIAVVPVVLFHAGYRSFAGGFVGVDVFFVISGFLISQILLRDLAADRYSILKFYERRVRRIIPALFAVLAFCILVAPLLYIPADLTSFAKSMLATLGFASNFYFWLQSGYFDADAHLKPLLHTWSLAVEEQFYIVYPLFLYVVFRFARRALIPLLLLAIAGSLLLSEWLAYKHPYAAFFLAPGRAWELGLGCLLAAGDFHPPRNAILRNALAAAGLAGILYAVFAFTGETPFPGFHALAPVGGTALLLYANRGDGTFVGRLLATPPMLGIGLVSYSFYLWHWPLLVFAQAALLHPPEGMERVVVIGLSLFLAWASWRFVENPFRTRQPWLPRRPQLFGTYFAATAILVVVGLAAVLTRGLPQRFAPQVVAMAHYVDFNRRPYFKSGTCFLEDKDNVAEIAMGPCLTPVSGETNVLLWGDSHAANYAYGLRMLEKNRHFHLMQATAGGCLPTVAWKSAQNGACAGLNHLVMGLLPKVRPDAVVIGGLWGHVRPIDRATTFATLRDIVRTLTRRGIRVYLLGPSIEYQDRLPVILARELAFGHRPSLEPERFLDRSLFALDREMRTAFRDSRLFQYLSVLAPACPAEKCPTLVGGVPMEFDKSHLTPQGSAWLVPRIFPKAFPLPSRAG